MMQDCWASACRSLLRVRDAALEGRASASRRNSRLGSGVLAASVHARCLPSTIVESTTIVDDRLLKVLRTGSATSRCLGG